MYKKKSANRFIRTIGSPGLSALTLSLYCYEKQQKTYLVLKFVPCIGQDDDGVDQYSKTIYRSTSLDYKGVKDFYPTIATILDGKREPSGRIL
jgi:hypothetical protein